MKERMETTRKTRHSFRPWQRLCAVTLAGLMVFGLLPGLNRAAALESDTLTTIADPETLTRPGSIYGDSTLNAGKVTVGKSVSTTDVTVNGQKVTLNEEDNFLITISQTAQVMGLASETSVPVDVVFVLDTSGSMANNDRDTKLVNATNSAIATLMAAHEGNRVGVVAFSSRNYGGGTGNNAAATVLSSLDHYSDTAATAHLQWVNSSGSATGNGRSYIAGRDVVTVGSGRNQRQVNAYRHGADGGTNIQAGIQAGARLLTNAAVTTYTDPVTQEVVTRIPFLVLVSDGQPTYTYNDEDWYDPAANATQQGDGNTAYEGNGFIAAMTAAYYKGKITEHYYGDRASSENRSYIYTMGVEIEALDGDNTVGVNQSLAQMTLDPAGESAKEGSDTYWNYGNTLFEDTKDTAYGWKEYWAKYQAGQDFGVRVNRGSAQDVWVGQGPEGTGEPDPDDYWFNWQYEAAYEAWYEANYETRYPGQMYTFTAESIAATRQYVSSIAYNDEYYAADDVEDLNKVFEKLLQTIQEKAISVPTKVTTGNHDFDGYVTFTDPIGEYMEVKDMKGVVAGGYFYQGVSFAQNIAKYGTANANPGFDEMMHSVIKTRMGLSGADGRFSSEAELDEFIDKLLIAARNSANQANYTDASNYDNSFVWWGNAYDSGEEDEQVQLIAFADDDSIDYVRTQKALDAIPQGADYVCRSYFFYGEAGGANPTPDHAYLYFVVRVQRELVAPYKQTVVISAPASLLAMEKVLITEAHDDNGNVSYTAAVEHTDPARVVYEVGLWDSITPETVSSIVADSYANEAVNGAGSVNYDASTDTYHFFTNDWDRTQSLGSHHRAMAKATFDAAEDNAFYTYQQDTLLLDANGNALTADPAGGSAYYERTYYEWSDNAQNGAYAATKKTQLIHVEIPADAQLLEQDGKWYIPKGAYTAATLQVTGDDVVKSENTTNTSIVVAHPHRTGDATNSHYTVLLGNNGKLSLKSQPYTPKKTVSVNLPADAVQILDHEGKEVKVGDVLTYTVEAKNVLPYAVDITVKDYVPLGTDFVPGSAGIGDAPTGHTKNESLAPDSNNVLTWVLEDVPSGATKYVSFQVKVNSGALSLNAVPGALTNTAQVQIGDGAVISTNTTHSYPHGKAVTDLSNQDIDKKHGHKVGDTLVYHIRFYNTTDAAADVTVTDKIPTGTAFVEADNGGVYDPDTGVVTWQFASVPAESSRVVSFRVRITAAAKAQSGQADGVEPATGEIYLPNTATITVGNEPAVSTNTTENWADVGDMAISKTVAQGGDTSKTFTLRLTESTGLLDGKYPITGGTEAYAAFAGGKAQISIKHGQTLTIQGLPAGTIITVEENTQAIPGWTPTYNTNSVTITKGAATAVSSVSVTNTYTVQPLTLNLAGRKILSGNLPEEATFGFLVEADSGNPIVGDPLTGEVTVKAEGSYDFQLGSKTFTKPGVYKYTVSEVKGGVHGVEYDTTAYTLVVNVTDNGDGTLRAEVTLDGQTFDPAQEAVTFENTFVPDDVPLTITAKKDLKVYSEAAQGYVDGQLSAGQFRFQIVNKDTGRVVASGANAADGTITFDTFYFTAALLEDVQPDGNGNRSKEFTYVISELVADLNRDPNMLYDEAGKEFKATLTYGRDGKMTVTVNGDSDGNVDLSSTAAFVNYQNPDSVTVVPQANKTTDDAPDGVRFSFSVVNTATGNEPAAGVGDANGAVTFSPLSYSRPGSYTYWIKESNAGNTTNGITYDNSRFLMKVEVIRDNYNRLVANVSYFSSATAGSENVADYTLPVNVPGFHNVYDAGGYINITASKELTGRSLNAGEFAFKLVRQDNGGEIDGIVDETGKITFSTLYYSNEDLPNASSAVIAYKMSEVVPATAKLPGVTYDTNTYDVYIRITDDGAGKIHAELVSPDGNGDYTAVTGTDTGVVFRNSYAPVNGDDIAFRIAKDLTGRDLREGEFRFAVYMSANPAADAAPAGVFSNSADGTVLFTTHVPATVAPDTYPITIKEVKGDLTGVTYDTASYTLYVKVADDGRGNIVASLVDASGAPYAVGNDGVVDLTDTVVFRNSYVPGAVAVQLQAQKELTGRDLKAHEFSFVVRKDSATGAIVATGSNAADGAIAFSTFDITAQDMAGATQKTFTYVVMESDNNVPGVTTDKTQFTVTVTVTDDGNGLLSAQVSYPDGGIEFVNTYAPNPIEVPLVAYKELKGKDLTAQDVYTFLLSQGGQVKQTVTNDENGVVTFANLKFTQAGTYTYTLEERNDGAAGVDYDAGKYTVTVEVTDDGKANLTAKVTYTKDTQNYQVMTFTNTYAPAKLELQLQGSKQVVDAQGNALSFSPAGFTFTAYDAAGNEVGTATSDENGSIVFADVFSFTEAGEYRFLIKENVTGKPGYTTDPTVWCVHFNIGYDRKAGTLYEVSRYIHLAPESHEQTAAVTGGEMVFRNTYAPAPVDLTILVKKDLTGRDLRDHEFGFYMEDTATGLRAAAGRNQADGTVKFHLNYTKAGTYTYTVHEEIPADERKLGGIEYDDTTYSVTVNVTDDGTGALSASVAGASGTVDLTGSAIFYNTYTPAPATYTPAVKKLYIGADMAKFQFVLAGDGIQAQTKENDDHGNVVFDQLTFHKAGTYRFTVTEKADAAVEDILWDTNTYTITLEVTDDTYGKLVVTSATVTSTQGRTDLVFRNVHEDAIAQKDVFLTKDVTVSIGGQEVKKGDELTYTIAYTNYTGKTVDVTVTDTIPAYTEYVADSADNGGVFADGVVTWQLEDVAPEATVVVSFRVKVTGAGQTIANEATVVEGDNVWSTNTVENPIEPPPITPDTGDHSQPVMLFVLMFLSTAGMILLGVAERKRRRAQA